MAGRSTAIGIVVAVASLAFVTGAQAQEHRYVGVKDCALCHKKELIGDQYGVWKKSKHSKAFEALKSDKAIQIAKEKGIQGPPSESKECLRCHVTAYGKPASAFYKKPLLASDGVQCESCHGPGSDYRKNSIMSDQAKAEAAGLMLPGKDEKLCTGCHNADSPTWDAAKGFDFAAAKKEIAHPIPKDVKGHYLEIAKQRRNAGEK